MKNSLIALIAGAAALIGGYAPAQAYETPLGPQPQFTLPGNAVYPAGTPASAIEADNVVKASIDNPHDNHMAERSCYLIRTDTGACVVEYNATQGGGDSGK